ncbi:Zn-ribbon domain-containing OB-fold protein [Celeribacter litoreus]|uniref:Zn-ribbon domain-containing OB-fold protein n=1 Tax=Celeribacter litoreus TaxID=2876714 RepID=UPI001CCD931A|nr:Zn-ribbon domain-containing OB-fold protein [Celeribacter litoreus]MCA0043367.1 Zn-ribbon domain-containing OB-fold protein [Celeribacter litoreus]
MASTLANGDSAPYFEGAEQGKLLFQKCTSCGEVQFPPRHHCAKCWEADLEWTESEGKGEVETFTIVRRAPLAAFRDKVPYVVASVIVSEGVRMIASLTGEDALDVAIGDAVTVDFAPDADGNTLPVFRRS